MGKLETLLILNTPAKKSRIISLACTTLQSLRMTNFNFKGFGISLDNMAHQDDSNDSTNLDGSVKYGSAVKNCIHSSWTILEMKYCTKVERDVIGIVIRCLFSWHSPHRTADWNFSWLIDWRVVLEYVLIALMNAWIFKNTLLLLLPFVVQNFLNAYHQNLFCVT